MTYPIYPVTRRLPSECDSFFYWGCLASGHETDLASNPVPPDISNDLRAWIDCGRTPCAASLKAWLSEVIGPNWNGSQTR